MLKSSSFAAAIGVFPYVNNGHAQKPTTSSDAFYPTPSESRVQYEDFESFTIIDENGVRYVFGRPLRGQKYVFSDDPYWSNQKADGYGAEAADGNFWKIDYIAEWLLTEILSPDYEDLNQNGIADDGDSGDWIRFEYTDPEKFEETTLVGSSNTRLSQQVPMYREWSGFSQTDRASSLMHELAYLKKIITPLQEIDFTISQRYDVDHDYYSKPANMVGNSYFFENRLYSLYGTTSDFDISYPVETMKYDAINVKSRLINQKIYTSSELATGSILLKYAEKGSSNELAVSSYLIRDNEGNDKLIDKPSDSDPFNMEAYHNETVKRGKTTLIGVEFYDSGMSSTTKTAYQFEYAYNPSYDEIHKREIGRLQYYPSRRQGYSSTNAMPNIYYNKGAGTLNYIEKRLNADGQTFSSVNHTGMRAFEFLIDFPFTENYYKFNANDVQVNQYVLEEVTGVTIYGGSTTLDVTAFPLDHPLAPVKDIYGYFYADNCTTCSAAWSLTGITYPTGGKVNFEYEQSPFLKDTDSPNWSFGENSIPTIKEYNDLAMRRSRVQDLYNRYESAGNPLGSGYLVTAIPVKSLTATFEVPLPDNYGIRLKKKTVSDRINPSVVTTYTYTNGHFTSLPSEYIQEVLQGFNNFVMKENYRQKWEMPWYEPFLYGAEYYDYKEKMGVVAHTNIALDDYTTQFFYESITTNYSNGSSSKRNYGSISGNGINYPVYDLFCFRLPSAAWGGRYTFAGNNQDIPPIEILSEQSFESGSTSPYQETKYSYEFTNLLARQQSVNYSQGTLHPNKVELWDNTFEIWYPKNNVGTADFYYFADPTIASSLYLPYNGIVLANDQHYSYTRWVTNKTLLIRKETNYKGLITTLEYAYDPQTYQIVRESSHVENDPNTYITTYEYADHTYNAQTAAFATHNLLNLKTRVNKYLNSVLAANTIEASMTTYDLSYAIPKPKNNYLYRTEQLDHLTGVFNLIDYDVTGTSSNSGWYKQELDIFAYNPAGQPVSLKENRLYKKLVSGNNSNLTKAQFEFSEREFDATYTGFEDISERDVISNWQSTDYLKEKWFANLNEDMDEPALSAFFWYGSPCTIFPDDLNTPFSRYKNAVTIDNVTGLVLGDKVEVHLTGNENSIPAYYDWTIQTTITGIYNTSDYFNYPSNTANDYIVCFSDEIIFPESSYYVSDNVIIDGYQNPVNEGAYRTIAETSVRKITPKYSISNVYARTGIYSYKLPTIREEGSDAAKTPIRPVKVPQTIATSDCQQNTADPESPQARTNFSASCYGTYEASLWLKYDLDFSGLPSDEPVAIQKSSDLSGDALYVRGSVSESEITGIRIVCDVWNNARSGLIDQYIYYVVNPTTTWKQYTVNIPVLKGEQKWIDVYVENMYKQIGVTINKKSAFVDDILVYPKGAVYSYQVFDKFGNPTYTVNNNDVFTSVSYDSKGRVKEKKNAYGTTTSMLSYFETPSNWSNQSNYLSERKWADNGLYVDTRYYIDGFGKTKQVITADYARNTRMVSETNVYNSTGRIYRSYKPYSLNSSTLTDKYDATFVSNNNILYGSDYSYTEATYVTVPEEKISAVSQPRKNSESAIVSFQSDAVNANDLTHPYLGIVYPAQTMIVYDLTDPLGRHIKSWVDGYGRVIMEEHTIGYDHTQAADGTISFDNSSAYTTAKTWFVYDATGRLAQTFDPTGKKTDYYYNSIGQLIKTISPDKGKSEWRYDRYGQVRFTKSASDIESVQTNIYNSDQFKYTKYDAWGRPLESGVLTVAPNSLGASVSSPPFPTSHFFDDASKVDDQSFPVTGQPFVQIFQKWEYGSERDMFNSTALVKQTSYSGHQLDITSYLYSTGTSDVINYEYMADGQTAKVSYQLDGLAGTHTIEPIFNGIKIPTGKKYTNSENSDYNFTWKMELDQFGRVKNASSIHNGITTLNSTYYYDALGNMILKGIGGTNSTHIDYQSIKLNIRDQVINSMSLFLRTDLTYDAVGNITRQQWSSEHFDPTGGTSSSVNEYLYSYDGMNRLVGADYRQSTLGSDPFSWFSLHAGNIPSDFSCGLDNGVINVAFSAKVDDIHASVDQGIVSEETIKHAVSYLQVLEKHYITNGVAFKEMKDADQNVFLQQVLDDCKVQEIKAVEYEYYEAMSQKDDAHIEQILNAEKMGEFTLKDLKYTRSYLLSVYAPVRCTQNPASTVYGHLGDFPQTGNVQNVAKYDAAYWYTDNGNITRLNRNDNYGIKTVQAYAYNNAQNNKLTGVT